MRLGDASVIFPFSFVSLCGEVWLTFPKLWVVHTKEGNMMNVVGVILGGGAGTRLQPLTLDRSKPAVPIAGKYRLVDIPISNCINSGIRSIFLLTQYNSVSLHQHISATFRFDQFSGGHVRLLAAEQTPDSTGWFQGTADAVRQSMRHVLTDQPDIIIVLSGDQLYRMNLAEVIGAHINFGADVTISTKPVSRDEAKSLGIMRVDKRGRIVQFEEKPGDTPLLDQMRSPYFDDQYQASMGIYVFKADVLQRLLSDHSQTDFGNHIIPGAIESYKVFSYSFNDYWQDIGTIRSFWEANLALTDALPSFSFYDMSAPIYTNMRYLPPSKINRCDLNRCLLSDGCIISGRRINHSVIGLRAIVGEGSEIEDSIVMGADFYEHGSVDHPSGIRMGIGKNCVIRGAIVDKNVRIGDGVVISPDGKPSDEIGQYHWMRDGIIVIPKNTAIPSGTVL